jgi:hypothetical protein
MEYSMGNNFTDHIKCCANGLPLVIKVVVKASEKDAELFFTTRADLLYWIKIPTLIIQAMDYLNTFPYGNDILYIVRLHLKAPESLIVKEKYTMFCKEMNESDGHFESCRSNFSTQRHLCNGMMQSVNCNFINQLSGFSGRTYFSY